MNKLISVFLVLTLLLISEKATFAKDDRSKSERIPAKKCKDKDMKGKYKNEGKVCIAIKNNPEVTGRCKKGYCREWRY